MKVPSPREFLDDSIRSFDVAAAVCQWFPRALGESPDPMAVRAIHRLLDRGPIRNLPKLDRAVRHPALFRAAGHEVHRLMDGDLGRFERLGEEGVALLGVATAVRDGYLREKALRRLVVHGGRLSMGFLLTRINDHVPGIAAFARRTLEARLTQEHAEDLVRCLPIVLRFETWRRADRALAVRIEETLREHPDSLRRALQDPKDVEVRLAALDLLARVVLAPSELEQVLRTALSDPSLRVRLRCARLASRSRPVPAEVFDRLRPVLGRDRAPAIRRFVLARLPRGGARPELEEAAFDVDVRTRILARRLLYEHVGSLDYRGRALAFLADPAAARQRVIGALAVLSEYGREEDLALLERFASDPRASVVREARRAVELLR